ncbi:MAG: T9SS type A sorting domain-containing protein, partial [Bacteroidetes bacterium]|nr:T9SS type A sorting domain-containing protein [Bacteroidota bacterium]
LIEKNKTERIPLYFSSPETNIYNSTIHLTIERSCRMNDSINLTAETAKMELIFRVSKHDRISPNLTNYEIPIYLKSSSTELNNLNIENIELELDRTLFYPKKVNIGNISKTIDTNNRIINISDININHLNANEELELCRIKGNVLLGQTDSTGIIIRNVKVSPESQNIYENGYLTIKTCTQGGNRLINYGYSPKLKIENNPVLNDVVNVECDVIEQGEHYLSIVNYLGKEVIIKNWNVQDNANRLHFAIPVNDLCSGTYILVLTTPTKKYSTNIVIAR